MRIVAQYLLFAAIATTGCGQQVSTPADFPAQRQRMVERQLKSRGIKDERVLRAMLLKIGAIAGLVIIGFAVGGHSPEASKPLLEKPFSIDLIKSIGAAMVPIAFAYGGWQTATFVAAEIRDPRRDLSRGLLLGVAGVVTLYLAVNFACLRVLGPAGLDSTTTPASDLMNLFVVRIQICH